MRAQAFISGTAVTRFGRIKGSDALGLMSQAADAALQDAGIAPAQIDGLLCGYATTLPHLMLADLFAEKFGLSPAYALAVQSGGATGAAMLMLARDLIRAGSCTHVLVVAGENRLSGQSRSQSIATLAQVGDPVREVPNGASVPAYYALLADRYMHETGLNERDLADIAVLMRSNASHNPNAHLRTPITVDDVLASKPVASPLKLLDCCPISDGAAAMVVTAAPGGTGAVAVRGAGQAHQHQHITALRSVQDTGASAAADRTFRDAGMTRADINYLAIYDSFTITLAMLLEETGFVARGETGAMIRSGHFDRDGALPLNTHGGLLSFGHSGVSGGMAHIVEAARSLRGTGGRNMRNPPTRAYVHGDGGVISAHVALILERVR